MVCQCGKQDENLQEYLQPLRDILEDYSPSPKDIIPILQDAQAEYGYLPEEVLCDISRQIKGLSFSQVYGVATFYSQFHLEPRGENIIRVCMGTACHVRGADKVLEEIEDQLGVEDGGTTDDLKFTIESVACIGACGLAPVIMVNDDTHGRLTPDEISGILEEYE